jgi:hypothetical protein
LKKAKVWTQDLTPIAFARGMVASLFDELTGVVHGSDPGETGSLNPRG